MKNINYKTKSEINYPDLKGLKVMLIVPNDYYRKKFFGLGSGYVATALKECNVDVSVMSCDVWSYDDIEIGKILIQSGVKIFGIGALYPLITEVERLCRIIRAVVPGATIILGGGLPSSVPEFSLRKTGADIAVCGEAEFTMPYLMSAIVGEGRLEDIPGLAFLREGEFVHTGKPNIAREVTRGQIGWPAWELFPIESYITTPKTHPFRQQDRVMTISTGRGCPFDCNFCFRIHQFRRRPADDILDEMEYLIDRYKLDGFYFIDDLTMLNKEAVKALCEGIINRGLKIKYRMNGRLNIVNREILKYLKDSGCINIFYGIESGNQEVLDRMSKKITLEQIKRGIALTREAGIFCDFGFMFGQPQENEKTLCDTVSLVKDLSYGEFTLQRLFGCIPFPGTRLYDWCKETGRLKDDEDFYNKYTRQDWYLDQFPINMTDLPDEEAHRLFCQTKQELTRFYNEKIKTEWPKVFGGKDAGAI